MNIPIYQVDAFHDQIFKGNPAAVCPLDKWLPDPLMQAIAMENNLSETAFFVKINNGFGIRWFTPKSEVDLCGHATLASAHVLFSNLNYTEKEIVFHSKSGNLIITRDPNGILQMNFPAYHPKKIKNDKLYGKVFGIQPLSAYRATKLLLLYENEDEIKSISPQFEEVKLLDDVGVIITSKGNEYDFVSRFFAPAVGINEDPVTGSSHSLLIPFWTDKLGKSILMAQQCSERGGIIYCENLKERVVIGGKAKTYMKGTIYI